VDTGLKICRLVAKKNAWSEEVVRTNVKVAIRSSRVAPVGIESVCTLLIDDARNKRDDLLSRSLPHKWHSKSKQTEQSI